MSENFPESVIADMAWNRSETMRELKIANILAKLGGGIPDFQKKVRRVLVARDEMLAPFPETRREVRERAAKLYAAKHRRDVARASRFFPA